MVRRHYSLLDKFLINVDAAINTVAGEQQSSRLDPAKQHDEATLSSAEKRHAAGLMRVNHSGEVCAQALYRGQLVLARKSKTKAMLEKACIEETDHLAWTDRRIKALDSHRSYLNAFWYMNSYIIGMTAALIGDRWSLGFIEETEKQVAEHLQKHLDKLPEADQKSRAVVQQMREDEVHHGSAAKKAGGKQLPGLVKQLMRLHARVMTTAAYWL